MLAAEAQFFNELSKEQQLQLEAVTEYWHQWCLGEHTCEDVPSTKPR